MVSTDLGDSWRMMQGFHVSYYVTNILGIETRVLENDGDTVMSNVLLVSAQSHLWDRNDGVIWRASDGRIFFERVSNYPTFTLIHPQTKPLISTKRRFEDIVIFAITRTLPFTQLSYPSMLVVLSWSMRL
jgi:hypothetical protein